MGSFVWGKTLHFSKVRQDKQDKSNVINSPRLFPFSKVLRFFATFKKKVSVFVGFLRFVRQKANSEITDPFCRFGKVNHWRFVMGIFAKVTRCE